MVVKYERPAEKAYTFTKLFEKVYKENEDYNFDNLFYHNVTQ